MQKYFQTGFPVPWPKGTCKG
ncbi:unnamed protein product, partial [Didymodactylos carnosus]